MKNRHQKSNYFFTVSFSPFTSSWSVEILRVCGNFVESFREISATTPSRTTPEVNCWHFPIGDPGASDPTVMTQKLMICIWASACSTLVAPYRAILRYYRCDTPYRAILFKGGGHSPKMVRYPPPSYLASFTQAHLCDTPFCNVSRDSYAIPHKKQKKTRKSFAILSLQVSRDMKSIAAGPLSVRPPTKRSRIKWPHPHDNPEHMTPHAHRLIDDPCHR